MTTNSESLPESRGETLSISQVPPETFEALSSRYRRVLYRVAFRVLRNHQDAEEAVRNCLRSASNNVPRFEHEGSFRSWLVRVLIDDALAILYEKRIESTTSSGLIPDPLNPSLCTNGEQLQLTECNRG
jgi:DNA-directed RNA polymerase specialized sigma24 family protein